MESEARYTIVGATLIALVLATIVAIFWLKSAGGREEADRYTIYFQRQSLDGLQVGAAVTMLGVNVGQVEDYAIDTHQNRVQVTVRVGSRTPISQNTTAVVQRNLVTGIARIRLVTPVGEEPGPRRAAVQPGEHFPIIPEGTSDLEYIADAANRIAMSGAAALDSVNETLSPENRKAFGQTLGNARDITAVLNARMDELTVALTRTANDLGRASRDLAEDVRKVQGAASPAAAQAEATLRDVSRAVERLERETAAVSQRVDTAIEIGSLELDATARELRATAEILARAADRFRDPRAALLGPSPRHLGPGERLE